MRQVRGHLLIQDKIYPQDEKKPQTFIMGHVVVDTPRMSTDNIMYELSIDARRHVRLA
jgi:hypothetical protein